ncbi:hypothetical protein AGMMS4957_17820 [Bacteroidia bacterium]|nr:hypothetical protein AGMMS4957_17820 [Bacteroidia bacterium]
MNTGFIEIIKEEGKSPSVEAWLVNNTVWLTKNELARLFNVYTQTIGNHLRSIFKSHLLWENDVSYTYRYVDKGVEKQIVYYNLDVLIFLSYHIASLEAQIFRKFVSSVLREHLQKDGIKKDAKLVWFFHHIGKN